MKVANVQFFSKVTDQHGAFLCGGSSEKAEVFRSRQEEEEGGGLG